MTMDDRKIQEKLLEHFKYPRNRKEIQNPTFSSEENNPSCGDKMCIKGIIKDGKVVDIGFIGSGCVISQATASLLTELCKDKLVADVLALTKSDILSMIGLQLGPNRLKCALLALQALQQGLIAYEQKKQENR